MPISKLDLWVQSVLPTVYDDSLSYLEFLGKVQAKVNELADGVNGMQITIDEFIAQFSTNLTGTVQSYLDAWLADGTLQALLTASLDDFNDALTAHKAEVTASLSGLEADLEAQITAVSALSNGKQSIITVNVKDYGAKGDGITNDQTAIQSANDANTGGTIFFPAGTYLANSLTMTCNWVMAKGARIKYSGDNGNTLVNCTGNYLYSNLNLDGDNKAPFTLLQITGSYNVFDDLNLKNLNANDGLGLNNSKAGLIITGSYNLIKNIHEESFINGGHVNGSMPQAITFNGTSDKNRIETFNGRALHCGIVSNNLGKTSYFDNVVLMDMIDNGIYALQGTLRVGRFTYSGSDEAIVVEDQVIIGYASIIKADGGAIILSANKADSCIEIGSMYVSPLVVGAGSTLIKTRSTNVLFDKVYIGQLEGTFKTATMMYVYDGIVNYMTINNVDLTFLYDASIATQITSWAQYTAVLGFSFKNWKVHIIDLNNVLTGSNEFYIVRNNAVTYPSYAERIDIQITNADKVTTSAGLCRMTNLAHPLVFTKGMRWQVNIGPYCRQVGYSEPDTATGLPATGSWRVGQILLNKTPTASGFIGWVCITAGSPGTWKTYGAISA